MSLRIGYSAVVGAAKRNMEKGFENPLHKHGESITQSSAKGFQIPSPYFDSILNGIRLKSALQPAFLAWKI